MRIIYDDSMQKEFIKLLIEFMETLQIDSIIRYDYGTDRVKTNLLYEQFNYFLSKDGRFRCGQKVVHENGIGNNNQYSVYYRNGEELQICCYINLNYGLHGEGYVSCEDYDGRHICRGYELSAYSKTIKVRD